MPFYIHGWLRAQLDLPESDSSRHRSANTSWDPRAPCTPFQGGSRPVPERAGPPPISPPPGSWPSTRWSRRSAPPTRAPPRTFGTPAIRKDDGWQGRRQRVSRLRWRAAAVRQVCGASFCSHTFPAAIHSSVRVFPLNARLAKARPLTLMSDLLASFCSSATSTAAASSWCLSWKFVAVTTSPFRNERKRLLRVWGARTDVLS